LKDRLKLASRAMQAGMVAVVVAGYATHNLTWVPAAVISIFVSFIPSILRRDLDLVLPIELNFWIVLALFLHVVGGFSGFYNTVPGWDHITHLMSASLIAVIGFVVVVTLDKYVETIYLPRPFLGLFIIMITMAVGVFWELMEFANDSIAHTHLQYGLADTMFDMMFDAFGGFVVAIWGTRYLMRSSPEHFVESLQVDQAKQKLASMFGKGKQVH